MSNFLLMEWKNDTHGARYYDKGEIVTCKDCKHGIPDREDGKIMGYECDLLYDSYWDADDFCSRGEKKDE